MSSSEQTAWAIYGKLSRSDRALVDSWRALGCDYADALLNSGCVGTTRRTHPRDRPPLDPSNARFASLRALGSPERARRKVCEHESAHAVVAAALGMVVGEVTIGADGSGLTNYERDGDYLNNLAVLVAAEVWFAHHRGVEYPEGDASGCVDDRKAAVFALGDSFNLRAATQRAHTVLQERRADVLALADRLEVDGAVDMTTPPSRY